MGMKFQMKNRWLKAISAVGIHISHCDVFHKMFKIRMVTVRNIVVYYHYSYIVYIARGITNEKDITDFTNIWAYYDTFFCASTCEMVHKSSAA